MKNWVRRVVLAAAFLLFALAAVLLVDCALGGILFKWHYEEPRLLLACVFGGAVLLALFRIIELLEKR